MGSVPPIALLALILVLAITFVVFNFDGPTFKGDDFSYSTLAFCAVNQCGNNLATYFFENIRYVTYLPIVAFYELFGAGPISSSLWFALAYLLTIAVVFYTCLEYFGDVRIAASSALLLAFFPLVLKYATTVDDDVSMMLMLALAAFAFVKGEKRSSENWFMAAGIFSVLAFVASPSALGFILLMVVYWLILVFRKNQGWGGFGAFAKGLLAGIALMVLLDILVLHAPFASFVESWNWFESPIADINTNLTFYYPIMFANPLSVNSAGLYFFLLVPFAIYLVAVREKRSYFFVFWAAVGFLLMQYGSDKISLHPLAYLPVFVEERYLLFLAVPIAIILGLAFVRIYDTLRSSKYARLGVAVLAAVVLADGALMGVLLHQQTLYSLHDQVQIAGHLENVSSTAPVYYLGGGYAIALIYMHYSDPSRFHSYAALNCAGIPGGSYVLVPDQSGYYDIGYLANPQSYCPSWEPVLEPNATAHFPGWATNFSYNGDANASKYLGERLYYVP